MNVTKTELEGVFIIEPNKYADFRGWYSESYSFNKLSEYGIDNNFIQDNHLYSKLKGTLRGIHFQNNPKAQAKLVRCTKGRVLDVIVDLRKNSKDYKRWISLELSSDNGKQVLVPRGFGHGVISLVDDTEVQYKVDNFYDPKLDRAIKWNDEDLNIDWGTNNPILSEKDIDAPSLKDSDFNF